MARRSKPGLSIFSQLLIVFVSVNVATGAALIFLGYSFSRDSLEKRTKETIEQQLSSIAVHFDNEFRVNLNRSMSTLIDSSLIDDHLFASPAEQMVTAKRIEHLFRQIVADYPSYRSVSFADADGRVAVEVLSTSQEASGLAPNGLGESIGKLSSDRHPTRAAAAELFETISQTPLLLSSGNMEWFMPPRELQVVGPYQGERGGFHALVGKAKLDLDTGDFGGVILIGLRLGDFLSYLRDVRLLEENPVWVFDAEGNAMQSPEKSGVSFHPAAHLPDAFQARVKLISVDQGLVAYQDFGIEPGTRFLRIAVSVPAALLTKDLASAVRFFSAVLGGSLVVVLILSLIVSRLLSRPIVTLAAAAANLAKGNLDTRVDVRTSGEVQTLVTSFNRMAADLRTTTSAREESVRNLETEVAERKKVESASGCDACPPRPRTTAAASSPA